MKFLVKNQKGFAAIIQLAGVVVLLIALAAGIYLVQQQQGIKSRASTNIIQAFEIKDSNDKPIVCDGSKNPPECETSTSEIYIKVTDLEPLAK